MMVAPKCPSEDSAVCCTNTDRQLYPRKAYELKGTKRWRAENADITSKQMTTVMMGRVLVAEFFLVHLSFLIRVQVTKRQYQDYQS